MAAGYLCMVLHAHLPFVRHPEYEDFLEEDWLYEAITETYIPFLEMMDGLERDGVDWRLTMSVSPTLAAMLADPLLQHRYVRHLENLITLSYKELERTRWQPEFFALAQMYNARFLACKDLFVRKYNNNLLNGFKHFFETGKLELITCAGTHGFLPLMPNENARRAQVELGCREFERHFGRRPKGMWLPEMAVDLETLQVLHDAGVKFTVLAQSQLRGAEDGGGPYWVKLPSGDKIAVFMRDDYHSNQLSFNIQTQGGAGRWARNILAPLRRNCRQWGPTQS